MPGDTRPLRPRHGSLSFQSRRYVKLQMLPYTDSTSDHYGNARLAKLAQNNPIMSHANLILHVDFLAGEWQLRDYNWVIDRAYTYSKIRREKLMIAPWRLISMMDICYIAHVRYRRVALQLRTVPRRQPLSLATLLLRCSLLVTSQPAHFIMFSRA